MARKIRVKNARRLDTHELRVCYAMSFGVQGDLMEWLYQARHWDEYKDTRVILVEEDGVLLGWGLRRETGDVGFWTRRAARGRGIGLSMVKTAAKLGEIKAHPHDEASKALFRKAGSYVKAQNYAVYSKDLDYLRGLKEDYESIGRDCAIEKAGVYGDQHKLTVFAYPQKKEKKDAKSANGNDNKRTARN